MVPATPGSPARVEPAGTLQTLHQVAEARSMVRPAVPPEFANRSHDEIIHKLQVHKIELEMQNEALRYAQRSLEDSRDRYAGLYDNAPVGYLILTENATIAEINMTGVTLFGIGRGKLTGSRIRNYIFPGDLERWDHYFYQVLRGPGKLACELRILKRDLTINVRMESIHSVTSEGTRIIRVAISDITDRVIAEANLAATSRSLDQLHIAYATIAAGQEKRSAT